MSELQALRWSDIEPAEDGPGRLTICKSKTDQHGAGACLSRDTMLRLEEIRGMPMLRRCLRPQCRRGTFEPKRLAVARSPATANRLPRSEMMT